MSDNKINRAYNKPMTPMYTQKASLGNTKPPPEEGYLASQVKGMRDTFQASEAKGLSPIEQIKLNKNNQILYEYNVDKERLLLVAKKDSEKQSLYIEGSDNKLHEFKIDDFEENRSSNNYYFKDPTKILKDNVKEHSLSVSKGGNKSELTRLNDQSLSDFFSNFNTTPEKTNTTGSELNPNKIDQGLQKTIADKIENIKNNSDKLKPYSFDQIREKLNNIGKNNNILFALRKTGSNDIKFIISPAEFKNNKFGADIELDFDKQEKTGLNDIIKDKDKHEGRRGGFSVSKDGKFDVYTVMGIEKIDDAKKPK